MKYLTTINTSILASLSCLSLAIAGDKEPIPVPEPSEDRLSITLDAGAAYMMAPENQFFTAFTEAALYSRTGSLDADEDDEYGEYFALGLEYKLDSPLLGSDRSGIALEASYANVETNKSGVFPDTPTARFGWPLIDNSSAAATTGGITLITDVEKEIQYYNIDALLTLEYDELLSMPIKVKFGPSFRHLRQEADINGAILGSTTNLNDKLKTDYFGVTVGASTVIPVSEKLTASIDFAIALYHAETDYRGKQISTVSNPGTNSASDSDDEFAYTADLRLGLDYQLNERTTLGAFVGVHYLSYAPQVYYGSYTTDPAPAGGVLLSLEDDDLLMLTGGLSCTIKF